MIEDIKPPVRSDFGKPRFYDFDTIGFSEEETRAIENAQLDAAASSQVPRAVYVGVPLSQAVRDGVVKEENGVYHFGNCKVSAKGSPIVAFDSRGDDFIMTKATGQRLTVETSQIDDADILFEADITIKNSQLCGQTKVMSRIIDDDYYQYNETATIEDSYVLDSTVDASIVKQSRMIDSEMDHSALEKAVLVTSNSEQSTIKDAVVEDCGLINSDVIRVGQVTNTTLFVSVVKDALSVAKSQIQFSHLTNSGRLDHVDAVNVSVENVTESHVKLRSDDANELVVSPFGNPNAITIGNDYIGKDMADVTADTFISDDCVIDASQFEVNPQKGLQH